MDLDHSEQPPDMVCAGHIVHMMAHLSLYAERIFARALEYFSQLIYNDTSSTPSKSIVLYSGATPC